MRTRLLTLTLGLLALSVAPSAHADGLPVEGVDASLSGVAGADPGSPRYVTLGAARGTVVAAVDVTGGQVVRSRFLPGRFTVPVVAYDGSASGLSADGTTLVLIRPRLAFPRRATTFAVLETQRLRLGDLVTLPGDFSFDAVSPDGRRLYLVQYLSKRDPTRYLVRLYDLERGRLLPEPIIDPREVGDVMRGMPITRASSPDGRFAYTLYDGAGGHPFIHALDTVEKTARCIDLHGLSGYEFLSELRLDVSPDGGMLSLLHRQEPVALVDTRTSDVSEPAEPTAPVAPVEPEISAAAPQDRSREVPWSLVAGGTVMLLLLLIGLRRVRKGGLRRPVPERLDDEREPVVDDADAALDGFTSAGQDDAEPKRSRVLVP